MARFVALFAAVLLAAGAWWAWGRDVPEDLDEMARQIRDEFPTVRTWSIEDLATRLETDRQGTEDGERGPASGVVLLDTRALEEYEVSHLPGAIHAATPAAARRALEGVDPRRPVILYCSVGYRSARLAEALEGETEHRVFNLEGSIFAWANSGRRVVRDGSTVTQVHPYDKHWGRLLQPELRADLD